MVCSDKFLNEQRLQGDEEADKLVADIFASGKQSALYGLLKLDVRIIERETSSALRDFMILKRVEPTWFDLRKLQNGQQLFKQYALELMTLLGVMSLPFCYAASPGNKALYLSDKMRNAPGKRLMDTASFVIEVLTPGSLDNEGTGHIHINKVRLIHAVSRYYLKKQSEWNIEWGQPINQEDMAGTNLAFSYVILLGMQQSGFILSQQEKDDFLFAWRYIGYLLSIHESLLPTSFDEARLLAAIIKKRNFKKTEEGRILTSELLDYYKASVPPSQADLVPSQVRFFLGDEVAEYIGLSPDPIRDRITSFVNNFKSLQNMLMVKPESYQNMLFQHLLLKKKMS